MNSLRRSLLGAAALLLARPLAALAAWNKEAFGAKSTAEALKSLGASNPAPSSEILIEAPQIAENGAVVPIEIQSNLAGTSSLIVLIDKNPLPLISRFSFLDGALPFVKLNVKMGETSEVRVLAQAGGRYYTAAKEIKVTIGGCGG
jgi:sulfur-oxidizing protein SoxY